MSENRIDAALPQADRDAVIAAIKTIQEKLPFLADLTLDERKGMLKLGDKSMPFVKRAAEIATQNPDFLPRSFNVEDMKRDIALLEALQPITTALTQLQELVDDTTMLVGSEAYVAALAVYQYAKASGAGGALDDLVDDLGRRFARKTTAKPVGKSEK
jgi:hypothetical protein